MRISEGLSVTLYGEEGEKKRDISISDRESFNAFFHRFSSDQTKQEQDSRSVLTRRQRLEACFQALLNENSKFYQDENVLIRLTGKGKMHWRLLTGPLQGCTLFASWCAEEITINFSAAGDVADRLMLLKHQLDKKFTHSFNTRLIIIKVTRESGYA